MRYLTPEQFIKDTTVPPGFEIKLFADETKFPDIAKPVQINFDNKGRLWVSCMPSYPQWKPGDPRPGDKLVILEEKKGGSISDQEITDFIKKSGFEPKKVERSTEPFTKVKGAKK